MSHDDMQPTTSQPRGDEIHAEPAVPTGPAGEDDPSSTVGTGTSLALGCVAGTLLLIVFGLIYLGLTALL